MKLVHFIFFMFFVSIILYLGLKNSDGVVAIMKQGGPTTVDITKALQGR